MAGRIRLCVTGREIGFDCVGIDGIAEMVEAHSRFVWINNWKDLQID